MEYKLRNGEKVIIRRPRTEDAEAIVKIMTIADSETKFLARNPGEFCTTVEKEREVIANILKDNDAEWFVAEYNSEVIGQCSVGIVRRNDRYRHRAEVAFVVLKDYWGLGIGGKMMQRCIDWCKEKDIIQIELDVVIGNERAMKMYEDFGFKVTGTIPKALRYQDGTFSDEYSMVLEL